MCRSKRILFTFMAGCLAVLYSTATLGSTLDETLTMQQQLWAKANFQLKDDAQKQAFERLMISVGEAITTHPDQASVWAWSGIIKSSYAAAKGGFGALSLAKAAKHDFEKALSLDPKVLEGGVYASLGLLYHKVPGWPIAFGSDDKAEKMFKRSLEINPAGRESNYFYGEFLYNEGKYQQAKDHLMAAKNVSEDQWQDKLIVYRHRQEQINDMLEKVDQRLARLSRNHR